MILWVLCMHKDLSLMLCTHMKERQYNDRPAIPLLGRKKQGNLLVSLASQSRGICKFQGQGKTLTQKIKVESNTGRYLTLASAFVHIWTCLPTAYTCTHTIMYKEAQTHGHFAMSTFV